MNERPRLKVGFIAHRKAVFGNRKLILSYVVNQNPQNLHLTIPLTYS